MKLGSRCNLRRTAARPHVMLLATGLDGDLYPSTLAYGGERPMIRNKSLCACEDSWIAMRACRSLKAREPIRQRVDAAGMMEFSEWATGANRYGCEGQLTLVLRMRREIMLDWIYSVRIHATIIAHNRQDIKRKPSAASQAV